VKSRPALLRISRARASIVVLIVLSLACVLVPALSPWRHDRTDLALGASPPSLAHWMGTDTVGRDLLVRLFLGGRVSLAAAVVTTTLALLVGAPWGAVAGYFGGWIDRATMRALEVFQSMPFLVVVVLLEVFFAVEGGPLHRLFLAAISPFASDPRDPAWFPVFRVTFLCVALGPFFWPAVARVARGQAASLRSRGFVQAARAVGARRAMILVRHILPNSAGPILAQASLVVPEAMLAEAALSFLGLGADEPLASFGQLVAQGAETMDLHPWLIIFPALALSVTVLCLHALGDAAREGAKGRSA
jgi:oligopeptide transport system permease protein